MNNKTTVSADRSHIDRLRADIVFNSKLSGHEFVFHSTWGLFSPRAVDEGTLLLLDYLKVRPDAQCIDLGCGYGPIGLALALQAPAGITHLIDKDYVAIDYALKNAQINSISNVEVYLSNGFSRVSPDVRFDLVVSNLPAKAGKELYYLYFYEALARMKADAEIYVVTVNGLRGFIKRVFAEVFGNYTKLKQGKNYTVSMARKLETLGATVAGNEH